VLLFCLRASANVLVSQNQKPKQQNVYHTNNNQPNNTMFIANPSSVRALIAAVLVCFLGSTTTTSVVDAHGYVTIGRANKCRVGITLNTKCGNVMYDIPGVEGFKGFPSAPLSPTDGKIASAGHAAGNRPDFAELDVQTATRWHKTPVKAGTIQFTWNFTTNHASTGW
jgi:predicted carbohydrate-binding protein with CBM5 and CBM33 domain